MTLTEKIEAMSMDDLKKNTTKGIKIMALFTGIQTFNTVSLYFTKSRNKVLFALAIVQWILMVIGLNLMRFFVLKSATSKVAKTLSMVNLIGVTFFIINLILILALESGSISRFTDEYLANYVIYIVFSVWNILMQYFGWRVWVVIQTKLNRIESENKALTTEGVHN